VYLDCGEPREDVIGILSTQNVGLAIVKNLARRYGSDRERAERELAHETAELLGLGSMRALTASERQAWRRWAPLVSILPGVRRWSRAERRALARVVIAKGGRRESDFVRAFDAHRKLRAAIRQLASRQA